MALAGRLGLIIGIDPGNAVRRSASDEIVEVKITIDEPCRIASQCKYDLAVHWRVGCGIIIFRGQGVRISDPFEDILPEGDGLLAAARDPHESLGDVVGGANGDPAWEPVGVAAGHVGVGVDRVAGVGVGARGEGGVVDVEPVFGGDESSRNGDSHGICLVR